MPHNEPRNVGTTGTTGTTGTGTDLTGTWDRDSEFWRREFRNRPYATADRGFEDFEPGYRYAYEMQPRYRDRNFNDVESDLRTGWDRFEGRGRATWENIKEATRDAWDRLTGRDRATGPR